MDFAKKTPRFSRRSFKRVKEHSDQPSGLLGILEAPPSPCRVSRTSSLRRTMKSMQPEPQVAKGKHVVDANDKSDDFSSVWHRTIESSYTKYKAWRLHLTELSLTIRDILLYAYMLEEFLSWRTSQCAFEWVQCSLLPYFAFGGFLRSCHKELNTEFQSPSRNLFRRIAIDKKICTSFPFAQLFNHSNNLVWPTV